MATLHPMQDIETMDTAPTAAIIAIGAVKMLPKVKGLIGLPFYVNVSLESCLNIGLTVSESTKEWWAQPEQAKAYRMTQENAVPILEALERYKEWLGKDVNEVWGNGSDFDNVILENAYRVVGVECPWTYRANRCYKTLSRAVGNDVKWPNDTGTHHNALDDAKYQAKRCMDILEHLKLYQD